MKRFLALLILLCAQAAFAATGDLVSAVAEANGWTVTLGFTGLSTNKAFAFGLGSNNSIGGSQKVTVTLTSMGFDDSGTATTLSRTLYGTHSVRFAYPNDSFANTTNISGVTYVKISLSDYIYQKDSNVVISVSGGLYDAGGTPNNSASNFSLDTSAVTNAYPKVIGNWSWPGYDRIASTYRARFVAFHSSAQQGRPVRCMKFSLTDGTNTVVNTPVTMPGVDWANMTGDQNPVVEYWDDLSVSTMTAKATGAVNVVCYPWMGDSGSILDTSTGTPQPTPLVGPLVVLCDKNNDYGGTEVILDANAADDVSGGSAAIGTVTGSGVGEPAAWKTLGKAYANVASRNSSINGHNDLGYGVVYVKAGTYAVMGSANSYGSNPAKTWITVKPYPGVSRASVIFASQSSNFLPSTGRHKFDGVSFVGSGSSAQNVLGGGNAIWIHNCVINMTSTPGSWWTGGTVTYWTWNDIQLAGGSGGIKGTSVSPGIVRGNLYESTYGGQTLVYTVLGNKKTGLSDNGNVNFFTSVVSSTPTVVNWICAYNSIYGYNATSGTLCAINNGGTDVNSVGGALVQNVFEATATASTTGGIGIGSDSTTGDPINNVIDWHNTEAGKKNNGPYNSKGSAIAARYFWSQVNTVTYDWNQKDDRFTGDGGANLARVGNWPSGNYGVGYSGNIHGDEGNGFQAEFNGLNSIDVNWASGSGVASTYFKYFTYAGYEGPNGGAGSGGGNYRVNPNSPLMGLTTRWVLLIDGPGRPRGANSLPGACGRPRNGFFFGQ